MISGIVAQESEVLTRGLLVSKERYADFEYIFGSLIIRGNDQAINAPLTIDDDVYFSTFYYTPYLTPGFFLDDDRIFTPKIATPDLQTLFPQVYFSGEVFYSVDIRIPGILQPSALVSDDVIMGPFIFAPGSLRADILMDFDLFRSPAISAPLTLLPTAFSDTDIFYTSLARLGVMRTAIVPADEIFFPTTLIQIAPLLLAPQLLPDDGSILQPIFAGPPTLLNFSALNGGTSGTAGTAALPSGLVLGDMMLAFIQITTTGKTIAASSGWTLGDTSAGGDSAWSWAVYDGTQSAPAFSWSGSAAWHAQCLRIIRASDTPIGAHASARGFGTTLSIGHLTTTSDPDVIIGILMANAVNSVIPVPAGFTLVTQYNDSTASDLVCSVGVSPAGSNTPDISVAIPSAEWSAFLIEITTTKSMHPALFADADIFFVPQIPSLSTPLPALWTDPEVFYSPFIMWDQLVPLDLWSDADTFYAPTFLGQQVLIPSLLIDTDVFSTPTVSQAAVSFLTPSLLTDADVFSVPTVLQSIVFFNATATSGSTSGTTGTSALVSSRSTGALMIAWILVDGGAKSFSVGGGWAIGDTTTTANSSSCWAWRLVDGAEAAPSFTWTGSAAWHTKMYQFRGNATSPIGAKSSNSGISTTLAIAGITTIADQSLVFLIECAGSSSQVLPSPSGYSGVGTPFNDSFGSDRGDIQTVPVSGSAATSVSVTITSASWHAMMIEILWSPFYGNIRPPRWTDADTFFVPQLPSLTTLLPVLWTDTDVIAAPHIAVRNAFFIQNEVVMMDSLTTYIFDWSS
jgi:hypothetical protein